MRTKFALAFYYIAVGLLVACAVVIVVKLIVFPPCAPRGNTCVVDPWSAAGLEGAVLGVSATVLAILGAVAVAGWWTSLNTKVNDQVKKLYDAQVAESNARVEYLLLTLEARVSAQLEEFQATFDHLRSETDKLRAQVEVMYKSNEDMFRMIMAAHKMDGDMLDLLGNVIKLTTNPSTSAMQNTSDTTKQP